MKTVFADTGYWIALLDTRDELHQKAEEVTEQLQPFRIVTTEMVLVETLTSFSQGSEDVRRAAIEMVKMLRHQQNIEVVPQTSEQFEGALERYASRLDKPWSLTDCASFVLMEKRHIWEALAEDHNFEQAGFVALLN